jgi:hypothetical protein
VSDVIADVARSLIESGRYSDEGVMDTAGRGTDARGVFHYAVSLSRQIKRRGRLGSVMALAGRCRFGEGNRMSSVGSARATMLALALASGAISPASAVEPRLDGAWAQDGSCEETFVRAGKGIAFKKPINVFAPALIITGNRLRTPTTSCTIKGMKPAGERRF